MSLIFMITPATASVPANSVLPLTTIARRTGRVLKSNSDSIVLGAPGYYKISVTTTFTVPAEGDVELKVQKNSLDVPGITASTSVATATTEIASLSLSGILRVMPFEGASVLSILNSGVAIDSSNIAVSVEYLG